MAMTIEKLAQNWLINRHGCDYQYIMLVTEMAENLDIDYQSLSEEKKKQVDQKKGANFLKDDYQYDFVT